MCTPALREAAGSGSVATAREVLNALRWRSDRDLRRARIEYADRLRPEGMRVIVGSEIVDLERRYFTTAATRLPYYKILRITYGDEVVFERTATAHPAKKGPAHGGPR